MNIPHTCPIIDTVLDILTLSNISEAEFYVVHQLMEELRELNTALREYGIEQEKEIQALLSDDSYRE